MNKKYNSLSIVGTQWGDEGKGKITNFLAQQVDMVVRYQGGNNAGHSIFFNKKRFSLHLLPSGIFNPETKNVMANGMVIDPIALLKEIEMLKQNGIRNFQLYISDRAHLVMPYHIIIDEIQEKQKGERKIGTTKRGIGPAYVDKFSRIGIRFVDFMDDDLFKKLLLTNIELKNKYFELSGIKKLSFEKIYNQYVEVRSEISKMIVDTSKLVYENLEENKKILFEGAQGILLCIDHGTYPFVTSSSPTSSSIPLNVGIPNYMINKTLGIVKAYSTRVGTGAFPTEIFDDVSNHIRKVGNEYGVTTGRPRRIGWFDANLIRHSKRVSGLTDLSITLLDVLTGLKKIKICKSYLLNGKEIFDVLASEKEMNDVKPQYIELDGWKDDISEIKKYDDLPKETKIYLKTIEKLTDVKISQISVGPKKEQTIEINKFF